MIKDPRERFSETAARYDRARPAYPSELLDWLALTVRLRPGARVADVGCGTGISTRLLAARGWRVVGIDPNARMLERARRRAAASRRRRPRYRRGESAATGLPDGGLDLVAAAQAFHWFPVDETLSEFKRILKPGGWCAAFWNVRAGTPAMRAYEALLRRHSREYALVPKPEAAIRAIKRSPEVVSAREASFPNGQRLDRRGFLDRVCSSSYVVHGVEDKKGFDAALDRFFKKHSSLGILEFAYHVRVLCWRFSHQLPHRR